MSNFTFATLKQAIKIYSTGGDFMSYLRTNTNQGSKAVKRDLDKLQTFLDTGVPAFSIWTQGNGKLPFLSFSAAPGEGVCPGAGDCLDFCYSFKAWRTFTPFARQLQNTILLDTQSGRDIAGESQIFAFMLMVILGLVMKSVSGSMQSNLDPSRSTATASR
jgi:hypothetical protein